MIYLIVAIMLISIAGGLVLLIRIGNDGLSVLAFSISMLLSFSLAFEFDSEDPSTYIVSAEFFEYVCTFVTIFVFVVMAMVGLRISEFQSRMKWVDDRRLTDDSL